jgi:hypothetical protein
MQAKDAHHSSPANASERRWADADDQDDVSYGWRARLRLAEAVAKRAEADCRDADFHGSTFGDNDGST